MLLTHPDRVVAAWLRSGVPLLEADRSPSGASSSPRLPILTTANRCWRRSTI
jgi:hypothetical protein